MKQILLALMLTTVTALAETNIFPVLHTEKASYTNARITSVSATHAIVWHDGGGARIPLTNFPDDVRAKLGYDPAKAAQVEAAESQRQKRIRDQRIAESIAANTLGAPERIGVGSPVGQYGQYRTDRGLIIIKNLPASVTAYLSQEASLLDRISRLKNDIEENTRVARQADAVTPTLAQGRPEYVNAVMNERARVNMMFVNIAEQKEELGRLADQLEALLKRRIEATTIIAQQTPQRYAGSPIYQCVGMAPPETSQQNGQQSE
jgi:hypothetical protein